jgi:1,4-alpha-glucan branching enzyme
MSLRKQYRKSGQPLCTVTFSLPKAAAKSAKTVHLVGEFNAWNKNAAPMKKLKNGSFSISVQLERNKEYQFRYLLNGENWENDWNADRYVPNDQGGDNSVAVV